jgi:hypothetical protein
MRDEHGRSMGSDSPEFARLLARGLEAEAERLERALPYWRGVHEKGEINARQLAVHERRARKARRIASRYASAQIPPANEPFST